MGRLRNILGVFLCMFCICILICDEAYADAEINRASSIAEFKSIVYKKMLIRDEKIIIEYNGKDYKSIFHKFEKEEFIKDLAQIDDVSTSDDYDYMIQNVSYMKTSMKGITASKVRFTIDIQWRESLEQLQYVSKRVMDILQKEDMFEPLNAYKRVKMIHDYIVSHVEYDTTLKYENAYSALKEGKSTCQGYSLLFYKMLTEANIPCRYITGIGINDKEEGPHGWNIVKIGDIWYNVDVTWDDPIYTNNSQKTNKINYDYFLKGSENFDSSHKRDKEYLENDFMNKHVMSVTDFKKENDARVEDMLVTTNDDVTERTLDVSSEYKEESFVEKVTNFVDKLFKAVEKGELKNYVVKSYNELSVKNKRILIALIGIIAISIVYRIYLGVTRKKNDLYDEYDENKNKLKDDDFDIDNI